MRRRDKMFYYKMNKDSKEYGLFEKYLNSPKRWYEPDIRKELEDLLEINIENNLGITPSRLCLVNPNEKYMKQFKSIKENDFFIARKDSKLQKAYLEICKKYDLKIYSLTSFWLDTNLIDGDGFSIYRKHCIKQIHHVYDDYYMESSTQELDEFKWLELVNEADFLELKSKYLREKQK